MSVLQQCSSRREEALNFWMFEPRHLGCHEVLKTTLTPNLTAPFTL